ncbi:hypothetical protein [Marinifilum flexuosum]|uniref:hypothetical protein n=1 Tax=Marinifilum flexuosum TaxID=1117708 RepID=UPI00249159BB|nr:hypothetical protein [Marinifilum flexuosum]
MLLPANVNLFPIICIERPDKYSLTPTNCIALINNERADINIEGADGRWERAVGRSLDADGR